MSSSQQAKSVHCPLQRTGKAEPRSSLPAVPVARMGRLMSFGSDQPRKFGQVVALCLGVSLRAQVSSPRVLCEKPEPLSGAGLDRRGDPLGNQGCPFEQSVSAGWQSRSGRATSPARPQDRQAPPGSELQISGLFLAPPGGSVPAKYVQPTRSGARGALV